MKTNICFAYPWATFGGCERVFINRAMAFKQYLPEVHVDFFFSSDAGGLKSFANALKKYGLDSTSSIVTSLDRNYDLISLVDCPQLFDKLNSMKQRYIVECHTDYIQNRQYLSALPESCSAVAAPSSRFSSRLKKEFPNLRPPILDLRNFVPWDIESYHCTHGISLPGWTRRPILFFGRMDKLKDPITLLDAFRVIEERRPGEFMLIFCGPRSSEIDIQTEIACRGLAAVTALLPPIPFHAAPSLLNAVRTANGVFVSPSHGESFGLSAAEAISALLPTVLSNIDAHLDLLSDLGSYYTFSPGDSYDLADRTEFALNNHSSAQLAFQDLRRNFSAERFIHDWKLLIEETIG